MKTDMGFWDKDGNYKEDIQEVEMLSVKDLNEIELIKAQNEGLKKQNADLQRENAILKEENYNKLIAWEEMQAENERLKALLNVLEEDNKKLSKENDVFYNNSLQEVKEDLVKRVWNLQTENKELAHYLACMTEQRNKANTCLQEIKKIAEEIADTGNWLNCGYNASRAKKILDLITKAEEE